MDSTLPRRAPVYDPAVEPLNELGFYTLAGHSNSPRDLVEEVRHAERLGLGSAFVSERFNLKDAATLSGAAAAVSDTIGVATGRRTTTPATRSSRRRSPRPCTA